MVLHHHQQDLINKFYQKNFNLCLYLIPARDKRRSAFASNFSFLSYSRIRSEGLTVECDSRRLAQIGVLSRSESDCNGLYLLFTDWLW